MVEITERTSSGAEIVKTYKIENTIIKICNEAYKDKSSEEIKANIKSCTELAYPYML